MSEHTPGPWEVFRLSPTRDIPVGWGVRPVGNNDQRCCEVLVSSWPGAQGQPEMEANAEHIVRACNGHDALLAACEAVVAAWDHPYHQGTWEAIVVARAALALASK